MLTRCWTIFLFLTLLINTSCNRQRCSVLSLREWYLHEDRTWIEENEPSPCHPYSLFELIELALCHNLDLLAKYQEVEVAREQACGSIMRMVPNLIGSYTHTTRNRNTAAFSESLQTGIPPAPLSVSLDSDITRWNVLLSWSLLDFGIAFFRSQQEQDKYLIKQYQYCRAKNKLILDVVQAYWKVVATKRWIERAENLLSRTSRFKKQTLEQIEKKWISDLTALESSKRIIDVEKDLMINSREYHTAKMALANLIGINPCIDFEVIVPEFKLEDIQIDDCCTLEEIALRNRPELYEKDMEEIITCEQAREAMLQVLPTIRGFTTSDYNSNHFLLFNRWLEAGYELSWNLLQAPYWWKQRDVAIADGRRVCAERLAAALGVMAQVRLSTLLVEDFRHEYLLFKEDYEVKTKLNEAAQKRLRSGEFHEVQVIIYEADALLAEIDALKAFASLQGAIEQLNNSIGLPLYYGSHP